MLFHPFKRVDGSPSSIIFVGYWDKLNNEWVCNWSGMFRHCKDNYAEAFIMDNLRLKKRQFTHWMPLPSQPEKE